MDAKSDFHRDSPLEKSVDVSPARTASIDQYILSTLNLSPMHSGNQNKSHTVLQKVPIDSPTRKLINFQEKRLSDKKEIARRLSPHKSFEKVFVYSNNPKISFETCMKSLENAKYGGGNEQLQKEEVKAKIEKSLAEELLPVLKEKMAKMYVVCCGRGVKSISEICKK